MVENAIRFNEPVNITTKIGNSVLISEEENSGLRESLYLSSVNGMREKLIDGLNTPLSETVADVPWLNECLEDKADYEAAVEGWEEYEKSGKNYSAEEVFAEAGLLNANTILA